MQYNALVDMNKAEDDDMLCNCSIVLNQPMMLVSDIFLHYNIKEIELLGPQITIEIDLFPLSSNINDNNNFTGITIFG